MIAYHRHALGDDDGGKASAIIKRKIADFCHAVGNGHGGQVLATPERPLADFCHAVFLAIIGNG